MIPLPLIRSLWRVLEPYYQLGSSAPESTEAFGAIGLTRRDQQYFGGRLAAVGSVGPGTAVALTYCFAPTAVARAVPSVWTVADPVAVLAARHAGVAGAARRLFGVQLDTPAVAEAARIAREAVDAADYGGRPLAASLAATPWPAHPAEVLWRACQVLREHRGEGHWAATLAEGIDGVETHLLHAADGAMPADYLQQVSGWDDASWQAGWERLSGRGLATAGEQGGSLTAAGAALKLRIEERTDAAAASPFRAIGPDRSDRLLHLVRPLADHVLRAGAAGAWEIRERLWRDLPGATAHQIRSASS